MSKLKNPLLSLKAQGALGNAITFLRRRKQDIVEKTPIPTDRKTFLQLEWRHMYQKAVALWHALSAEEKQEWESLARRKHMTGFAWFVSQALKPNPGLYLPLQGGSMSGDIVMEKNRILKLPLPTDTQEPLTLAYFNANIAPYLYNEGARAYHSVDQSIPNITATTLAFNSERWDTDNIHDLVTNNSRLTCQTAGKYLVATTLAFGLSAVGRRLIHFILSGGVAVASFEVGIGAEGRYQAAPATIANLAVGDFLEVSVYQSSGGALDVRAIPPYSAEFMMQRIGT